jgi:ABC-type sugar transport system substrate-binding protein
VREVGKVARAAGKPVIAFSTDTSTAGQGLFLLSFLIENYVDRIVDFAASKGKKSIAALIPENDYGRVAETEFQQAAARNNIRVMSIEHYEPRTMAEAVQKIAALHDQIDSLFIPEQADAMQALSQALTSAGINGKQVQILGTGLWNDARVAQASGVARGVVRGAREWRLQRLRGALPRQISFRSNPHRDTCVRCRIACRGARPIRKARSVIRKTS